MGQAPGALQKPQGRFSAQGDVCQWRREERVRWHGRFSLHAAAAALVPLAVARWMHVWPGTVIRGG